MPRPYLWIVPTLALIGCGGSDAPAADAETAADSSTEAVAPDPAASAFDPGAIEPGDTLLGLTVVSKDVERVFEDSVWVGNVVFEGDLIVQGVYQPHVEWPEVTAPCFHVTDRASIARIPRFAPDAETSPDAKTWFCFSNPEVALELLGSPERPRELVVALSRYRVWREFTEANDEGELAEVLEIGPESTATLRDR